MIKLVYFDFNFWRIDILRLSLGYSKVPYEYKRIKRQEWQKEKQKITQFFLIQKNSAKLF